MQLRSRVKALEATARPTDQELIDYIRGNREKGLERKLTAYFSNQANPFSRMSNDELVSYIEGAVN